MNLEDLTPDPANRRKRTPRNVEMLTDALRDVGAARSIVIDEHGEVLAGNGVVEAAAAAGMQKVQVVDADGSTIIAVRRSNLSAEQKRALAIYDNRSAELAEWDVDQLRADADADLPLQPFFTEQEEAVLLGTTSDGDWSGMPDFRQPDANGFRTLTIHFRDQAAVDAFSALVGPLPDKAHGMWWPRDADGLLNHPVPVFYDHTEDAGS